MAAGVADYKWSLYEIAALLDQQQRRIEALEQRLDATPDDRA